MSQTRYQDWLDQGGNDLEWCRASLEQGFYSQTCFIAQQAAEKFMKALAFFRGYDLLKSHSLVKIARDLKFNAEVTNAASVLDLYYISARYPDALPEGAPYKNFTTKQAEEALQLAELIHLRVIKEIKQ